MNSLEALELLVMPDDVYDKEIRKLGLESNRFLPYETIKRDLEVLSEFEILKDYYPPFKEFLMKMFDDGYNGDLTHLKEWLDGTR